MQVTVENTSSIGRKVNVVVPAEKIETAVQTKLKQLSRTVKMQGFRPGKVPMKLVEQQYRGSATSDVLTDVIQETLYEALSNEKITPAVQPDIEPESLEKGKDFTYVASFDVYPEVAKIDLDGVKLKKPESDVGDADVDKVIETMRKQQIEWNDVERKAKKEDRVTIDFTGSVDGEEFEGGSASDYPIVLGEGQMLPDFEKGITGMKAGESKEIDVTFPDDYKEDLAGKKAVFKIDAKLVSESELPEINEEFIKSFAIESGVEADLRAEVRKNLETNLKSQLSSMTRERVFDALLEQNDIEVPAKMVTQECQRMAEDQKNQLVQQGIDPSMLKNMPEPDLAMFEPQAKKRVALGIIMMDVVEKKELKPDEARVDEKLHTMAAAYQDSEQFVEYYKSNQQALAQVQSMVLEEQVVDLLLEKADVEKEEISATELLKTQ